MPNGFLKIQLTTAQGAVPVPDATIRIYKDVDKEIVNETFYISDNMGVTPYIPLYAPSPTLSLDPNNRIRPYETYNIEVRCTGFETLEVVGIQIFACRYTTLPLSLVPTLLTSSPGADREVNYIPDHQLLTDGEQNSDQMYPPVSRILSRVTIPKRITVHLGRPTSNAENLNVDFIYYLKNVASSEIYPTWEEEALRANIYCQISLVLNRIYTEWYPSKGYSYDITNSTAYDQAFVKNRNIFDNISEIVDDIFNQYIQKDNFSEPYYAEYCDGKIAQCPGLKQWGTQTLALNGYDYLRILKYYYGDNIQIVTTNHIQDIKQSYPGTPLRLGSSGIDVTELQKELNAIAVNYPNITPIYPIDGIFGSATESAVKVFQRQFSLTADGVVGKSTWYKISYVYAAVRKLAELVSIGDRDDVYNGEYPGTPLRQGSRGIEVQLLQYYLSVIATYDNDIKSISRIDGRFGDSTYNSVVSFQRKYNLTRDGIVGELTWNRIRNVFETYQDNIDVTSGVPAYPGTAYQTGTSGDDVVLIQQALNTVGTIYSNIPILVVDGFFGSDTANAVRVFQSIVNEAVDGIVGPNTWVALFTTAAEIQQGDAPSLGLPPFPGTVLREGSRGEDVLLIQRRLQTIAAYYPAIPEIAADRVFGPLTTAAVVAFQQLLGLDPDGIIGQQTWYKINEIYRQLTV